MSDIDTGPKNRVKFDKTEKVLRSFWKGRSTPVQLRYMYLYLLMVEVINFPVEANLNFLYVISCQIQ
jgi:hypothetical protein